MGIAISLVLLVVGIFFFGLLDGQVFTNSFIIMSCCLASLFLCLWEWRRPKLPRWRRVLAIVFFSIYSVLVIVIGLHLPGAHEFQKNFNKRVYEDTSSQIITATERNFKEAHKQSKERKPTTKECNVLGDQFVKSIETSKISSTKPTYINKIRNFMVERCSQADRDVLGCIDEILSKCKDSICGISLVLEAPACVQKHRILAGRREGVCQKLTEQVSQGFIVPDKNNIVVLPDPFSSMSLDGKASVLRRSDGAIWIVFKTWCGRHRNMAGYLCSSKPLPSNMTSPSSSENTLYLKELVLADPCQGGPTATFSLSTEAFSIGEVLDQKWILIHFGWD